MQGLSDAEIMVRVEEQNLFQYPNTTDIRRITRACLYRVDAFDAGAPGVSEKLCEIVANGLPEEAAQANLYAMMVVYPLMGRFMMEVVAEHLQQGTTELTRQDLNSFFTRMQVEDSQIATWTENTIRRIKSTFTNCLVQAGYLEKRTSTDLKCPLLSEAVKDCIAANGDARLLPAFGEGGVY